MSNQAKQLIAQAKAEGWKRLELGKCGLRDLEKQVPELFELTDLEELVLSNEWHNRGEKTWTHSQNKGYTNHLSRLPQAIAKLKQLKVLICCGGYFTDWSIRDYSAVQHLHHLIKLDLSGNRIARIGDLGRLANLRELNLNRNIIARIENLGNLPNLRYLNLSSNQIMRIENLNELTNLQELHLSGNQIKQIENLDNLPNLQQLHLAVNQITRIENLDKLPNLQQLELSHNQIVGYSDLAHAGLPATCKVYL